MPQAEHAKYLGIHLDRSLSWRNHIFTKRKALGLKQRTMHWLIGQQSNLSLENKVLLYTCKTLLKPVSIYGAQLWGTALTSNIAIIQRYQSKILRMIRRAPWYISYDQIHMELYIPTVDEEVQNTRCF